MNKEDQADYIEQVFDRTRRLIQTGVWEGMKESRLEAWRGCLDNQKALLLGAYLLDNLCFRSKDQFYSMLDALFLDVVDVPCQDAPSKRLISRIRNKPGKGVTSIRVAPVIGLSSPPTKSGPYILRLAQRRYRIHSDWLTWPQAVDKVSSISHLVFVDDFCGTGEQFTDFAKEINLLRLNENNPHMQITYLAAAAHTAGVQKIAVDLPFVRLKYAELLDTNNAVLSDACFARYEIEGFQQQVLDEYQRVVEQAGLPKASQNLASGYGGLGLGYAFAHATPNNTLPIFWYETEHWTPLLER